MLNPEALKDVGQVAADIVLAVIGGDHFRDTPLKDAPTKQGSYVNPLAGRDHKEPQTTRPDIDASDQGMTTIDQHQIGRGAVHLPDTVEPSGLGPGTSEGKLAGALPFVGVGKIEKNLSVLPLPFLHKAPDGVRAR